MSTGGRAYTLPYVLRVVIDPYNGVPVYQQLAAAIRSEIVAGRLSPGSRLPSEKALVQEHGIGRTTVRAALRELRTEGLIVAQRGTGNIVREMTGFTRRQLPPGAIVRLRMPTPRERRTHQIPDGVPVAVVTLPDGKVRLYVGDRDELAT